MRKIKISNRTIDIVFSLILFAFFTVAMVSVLVIGARSYQGITEKMDSQYAERTCLSYIDAKLRHYDAEDAISIKPFGTETAIVLREQVNETTYETLIYYFDGYVRELYCETGLEFSPEAGARIISARGLSVEWKLDGLLEVICTGESGRAETLLYAVRSAVKGADSVG